ncbi:MAG: hypothetical protein E7288_02130 [Lachnospiraceae bacterium]|nr:hypothetical protein [Lachnospiraceae bacterium]
MIKKQAALKVLAMLLVIFISVTGMPFSVSADNGAKVFNNGDEAKNFPVNYDPNEGMIPYGYTGEIGMLSYLDDNNRYDSDKDYVHFPDDLIAMEDVYGDLMFPDYSPDNPYYDYTEMFNCALEVARAKGNVDVYVEEGVYYFTESVWLWGYTNINGVAGKTVFVVKPNFTDSNGDRIEQNGFFANKDVTSKYAWYFGRISDMTFVVEGSHETFTPEHSAEEIHANLLSDDVQSVEGYALFDHIRIKYGKVQNIALSGFCSLFHTCFIDMLTRVTNVTVGPCRIAIWGVETNDAFFYDNYFYGGYFTKDELHEIPIFQMTFSMGTTVFSNSYICNFYFSRNGASTWNPHTSYSNLTFERTYNFVMDTTVESSSSVSGCLFRNCSYRDIKAYFDSLGLKAYDHATKYFDYDLNHEVYPDTGYIIRDSIVGDDAVSRKKSSVYNQDKKIALIQLHNGIAFSQNKIVCDSLEKTTLLCLSNSEWSSTYDGRRSSAINVSFADNAFEINEYVKEDLFIDDWKNGKPLSEGWHDNIIIEWGPKGWEDKDGNPVMGYIGVEGPNPVCWMEDHIYVSTDLKRYVDLTAFKSPDQPALGYAALGKVGANEQQLSDLGIRERYYEDIQSGEYEIVSLKKDFGAISWNTASNHQNLQRAFDYIASHDAILFIESGTYYIDKPIVLRGGKTYRVYAEGGIRTSKTNEIAGAGAFVMSGDDNAPIDGYFINVDLYLHNCNTSGFYQVNTDDFYFKMRSVQRGVGCFTECNLKDTIISDGQIQYNEYGFFYRTVTDNTVIKYVYGTGSTGVDPAEGYTPGDITYKYFISSSDFAHSTWRGCWLEFGQFANGKTLTGEGNSIYRGNLIDYTFNYSFGRNDVVCGNTMTRASYSSIVNHMVNSNFPIDLPDALTDKPMIMYHINDGMRLIGNMCIGTLSEQTHFVSFDSPSIRYKDENGREVVSISNARVAGNGNTSAHLGVYKIMRPITPYDRADNIVLENCKNNTFNLQNFYFVDQEDDPDTSDVDETFHITKADVASWSVPLTKTYVNGEALVVDYPKKEAQKLTQIITEPSKQEVIFDAPNECELGYEKNTEFRLYDFKNKSEKDLENLKETFYGFVDKQTVQIYRNSKYNVADFDSFSSADSNNAEDKEPASEKRAEDASVVSDDVAGVFAEESTEEISEAVSEEVSEEASEEVSEETTEETSEEAAEESSEADSEEASQEPSEDTTEETPEEIPEPEAEEKERQGAGNGNKRYFTYNDIKHLSLEEKQDIYMQAILYDIRTAQDGKTSFYMYQKRPEDVVEEPDGCAPTYALVFDDPEISGEKLVGVTGSFYQDFVYAYTWINKRAPVIIFSEDEENYYGITIGYTTSNPNLGIFYTPTRIIKNYENGGNNFNDPGDTAVRSDEAAAEAIGAWSKYAVGLTQYDALADITRPNQGEQEKYLFGDYTTTSIFGGDMSKYGSTIYGVDFRMEYNDVYETVKLFATFDFSSIGEDTSVTPSLKATRREVFVGTFSVKDKEKIFGLWGGDETWIESFQFEYAKSQDSSCQHDYLQQLTREGACNKCDIVLNTCKKCGYSYEQNIPYEGHNFVDSSESSADKSKIIYTHVCKDCGFSYQTELNMFACRHDWEEISKAPLTCLSDGYLIRRCTKCEEVDQIVYKHYGHDFELSETVEPTETSQGYRKYYCKNCDEMKMEYLDIIPQPGQKVMNGLWCTSIPDQTYTGKAIKPEVKVYFKKTLLQKGKDYTISYKRNVNANNALDSKTAPTIEIKGKGNYTGVVTKTFKIKPKSIYDSDITIEKEIYLSYNGKTQKKVPTIKWGKKKLVLNKDYKVSFNDGDSGNTIAYNTPGKYAVRIDPIGNYGGLGTASYIIISENKPMSKVKIKHAKTYEYTGEAVEVSDLVVTYGKEVLELGKDYWVAYENNVEIGTATLIVYGNNKKDKFFGTKKSTFRIVGTSINKAKVTGLENSVYTSDEIEVKPTVTLAGKTLVEKKDYVLEYSGNINPGTAKVTIKGIHAYSGSLTKKFKILPYNLIADEENLVSGLPESALTYSYVKGGVKPKLTLMYGNMLLKEGKDYTLSYKGNNKVTNAATLTVKGKGRFAGSKKYQFGITAKDISGLRILTPDIMYKNKKGNYVNKPVITDVDGKKLVAGKDYEKKFVYKTTSGNVIDSKATLNVGDVIVVFVNGKGNYTGVIQAKYTLSPSDIKSAKVSAESKIYTGEAITLSEKDITIKINNTKLSYGKDFIILEDSYTNNVNKGTATVTIKGVGNYAGSKTVSFKIKSKPFEWAKDIIPFSLKSLF